MSRVPALVLSGILGLVACNGPVPQVTGLPTSIIELAQSNVRFIAAAGGANPVAQTDSVDGSAGTGLAVGAITYGTGEPTGWLSANLSDTMTPATLMLSPTKGTLGLGTYTAAVTVTAPRATDNPQTVNVTLAVVQPLELALVSPGGYGQTCGVAPGGVAYCWGNNTSGDLGNGSTTNSATPVAVSGGITFTTVSTGGAFGWTCGLTPSGAAYCWGDNSFGELGDGTTTGPQQCLLTKGPCSTTPVPVSGGLTFATLTEGASFTCGITTAGAAYCWGDGGTVRDSTPAAVAGGLTFAAVSAGGDVVCGLTPSGVAYCWGDNTFGELGNGSTTSTATPVQVSGGLEFTTLSVGAGATICGLATGGVAYCWGLNVGGALGNGARSGPQACQQPGDETIYPCSTTPVAVAGGLTFTGLSVGSNVCATTPAGAAYCWGGSSVGGLGTGTTTGPEQCYEIDALTGYPESSSYAPCSTTPVAVAGGITFTAVMAGGYGDACGLTQSGITYCWGENSYGELGTGMTTGPQQCQGGNVPCSPTPVPVSWGGPASASKRVP